MPTYSKIAGSWQIVKSMFVKQSGVWVPIKRGYIKVAGAWVEMFSDGVLATVSANTTNLNVSTLFSLADWQDPLKKKVVVIAAGVIVGSANPAIAALLTGTGRSSTLEIIVQGEVQGAGGAANGGVGGQAIDVQQTGATITINGAVRSGGGGGGKGGAGQVSTLVREPASGNRYNSSTDYWFEGTTTSTTIRWNNANVITGLNIGNAGQYTSGIYTYYRSTERPAEFGRQFELYRTSGSVTNTAGGNGGRGQGYDGAAASGAAGGTNAGAGGSGGTWGVAGLAGSNGNNGSGLPGGAAGAAIAGLARTIVNNGTINGAVV